MDLMEVSGMLVIVIWAVVIAIWAVVIVILLPTVMGVVIRMVTKVVSWQLDDSVPKT
jgi:hypothetical protein